MPRLRIGSLEWGVGIFCALLGALTLVAPHQFDFLVSGLVLQYLPWWGGLCLLAGFALVSLPVFFPKAWITTAVHFFAGFLLLFMVAGFTSIGGYIGTVQYSLLGVGTVLAGLVPARSIAHQAEDSASDPDLLSLVLGLTQILAGLRMLLLGPPLNLLLYSDLSTTQQMVFGGVFVLAGAGLCLVNLLPDRSSWLGLPWGYVRLTAYLAAGLALLAFLAVAAMPQRVWITVLYYLGFGLFLLLMPWSKTILPGVSQRALRVRLALALSAAAAIPLIISVALTSNLVEQAVQTEARRLQAAAAANEQAIPPAESQQEALAEMASGLMPTKPNQPPLPDTLAAVYAGRDLAYGILLVSLLFTALTGALIATWLSQPLSKLATAAHQLALGISTAPLPSSRVIEIQQVANAFNEMRHNLDLRTQERQQAEDSLRRAKEALEMRVSERTAELRRANEQLTVANLHLATSNQRLQTVMSALPVAVWISDPDGKIVQKNEMAERIWSGTSLPGESGSSQSSLPKFWTSDGEPLTVEEWPPRQAIRSGKTSVSKMIDFEHADGRGGTLLVSAAPITDENGEVNGAVAVAQDITQQRQLERQAQLARDKARRHSEELSAIFNSMTDGVFFYQADGKNIQANPAGLTMLGFNPTHLQYHEVLKRIQVRTPAGEELPAEQLPINRALRGERVTGERLSFVNEHGRKYEITSSVSPIWLEDKLVGVVAVWRDITERERAEEARRQSERLFRSFIEQSTEGIVLVNDQGIIHEWNRGQEEITGVKREEAVGQPVVEIQARMAVEAHRTPELLEQNRKRIEAVLKTGQADWTNRPQEQLIQRVDGDLRVVQLITFPIRTEKGWMIGSLTHDITIEKQAEIALRESEARERARAAELEAIMSAVPAVVWIAHDPECRHVTGNQPQYDRRRLYGWGKDAEDQDEGSGPFFRVYRDGVELKPHEMPLYLAASQGVSVLDFEEEVVFEGGDRYRLYGNVTPLLDESGRPRGAVAAFVDITRRYQAELGLQKAHSELRQANEQMALTNSRLAQANEQLQVELNERKRAEQAVKAYARQLEQANRELKDFTFIASHDLQEPLRKVRAFGDRLKNKFALQLGEDGVDYLERMSSAAERMQTMLNDLLSYSRVTTKVQSFVRVDLGEIVREVMTDIEFLIERSEGYVEVGELPVLEGDPLQLRQLMQNLIANGLKFRKPDVPPVVKVYSKLVDDATQPGGKIAQVMVEDNGIGFEEIYLDRIFQPFQRLHGRSEFEGSGIGLAICRKVVERHQGRITAESTPGVGSTFNVYLPLQQKETQDGMPHESERTRQAEAN